MVFSSLIIALFINILIIFLLTFSSHFVANNLLHESRTYYGLIAISFVLPFIIVSSILIGYFFCKEKMLPHLLSHSSCPKTLKSIKTILLLIKT